MMRSVQWTSFACLLLCAATARAQVPDHVLGDWHGVLDTPQGELTLIVSITLGDDGELSAELESRTQAPGQKIPLRDVRATDDSLSFSIRAIGASYRGVWVGEREHWAGEFTQGIVFPLTLERGMPPAAPVIDGLDGTWEGSLGRNDVDLRLVLRVRTDERGTSVTLDSPDMVAYGLPVSAFILRGDSVAFEVPAASVRYAGLLADGGASVTGQWIRPGQPAARVTFVRTATSTDRQARGRPQMPREPFEYRVEDVAFDNPDADAVTLAGTLTLPSGTGPFPAAILISGSGPQDRDETVFGHKPFAVLADHLTRHGVAVLRYDDRGFGESTGDHGAATSADFATDANAAASYLLERPEIDPAAIGFIGHSEGGMIAPIAATGNDRITFVILLSAPGTSTVQLIESQRRLIGLSQGLSEADLDRSAPVVAEINAALLASTNRADAEVRVRAALTTAALETLGLPGGRDAAVQQFTRDWYRYFLGYDATDVLSGIKVPVLALNGALDQQVPADENLAAIAAALAHNPDATVRKLDGLNHMFQTARTGAMGEYADISETFAPVALQIVTEWIKARFATERAAL